MPIELSSPFRFATDVKAPLSRKLLRTVRGKRRRGVLRTQRCRIHNITSASVLIPYLRVVIYYKVLSAL